MLFGWTFILLTAVAKVRGGNLLSSRFAEDRSNRGNYYPLMPYNVDDDDDVGPSVGPSVRPRDPATYVERESARGDLIVNRVKHNEAFAMLPRPELRGGAKPVREYFSAHLSGFVQGRLLAGGGHASYFYDTVVLPKLWQFTEQHFVPILRLRVFELRADLPDNVQDGATVIKRQILAELPSFEMHNRAMQHAVNQEVQATYAAAVRARLDDPVRAAIQRLQLVTGWRLTRAEYDNLVQFVDRNVDQILTRDPAQHLAEDLFEHLRMS